MDASISKIADYCTKLSRDGKNYYFMPHITIITKNNRITVQSSSQHMLLERLTTQERNVYDIDFDTLDLADRLSTSNAVELVEKWIETNLFQITTDTSNVPTPGNSKLIIYYPGVEAGNPSGDTTNAKFIEYYTGATLILRRTIAYNAQNQPISITDAL
jgi:hypothetical protein